LCFELADQLDQLGVTGWSAISVRKKTVQWLQAGNRITRRRSCSCVMVRVDWASHQLTDLSTYLSICLSIAENFLFSQVHAISVYLSPYLCTYHLSIYLRTVALVGHLATEKDGAVAAGGESY